MVKLSTSRLRNGLWRYYAAELNQNRHLGTGSYNNILVSEQLGICMQKLMKALHMPIYY
jgi:hypothetical protein